MMIFKIECRWRQPWLPTAYDALASLCGGGNIGSWPWILVVVVAETLYCESPRVETHEWRTPGRQLVSVCCAKSQWYASAWIVNVLLCMPDRRWALFLYEWAAVALFSVLPNKWGINFKTSGRIHGAAAQNKLMCTSRPVQIVMSYASQAGSTSGPTKRDTRTMRIIPAMTASQPRDTTAKSAIFCRWCIWSFSTCNTTMTISITSVRRLETPFE